MFHYAMIILILHGSKAKQNISTQNLIKVKVYTETMLVQNYTTTKTTENEHASMYYFTVV